MLDVREGHKRRVASGLFCGLAPYGFKNVRVNDRGLIEVSQTEADNVRLVFDLYAYKNHTIDMIVHYTHRDRSADEHADLVRKAFELSQSLPERWLSADYSTKRQIMEMICLNFSLEGVSLVPEWRKPFDLFVGGLLVSSSRGDKI